MTTNVQGVLQIHGVNHDMTAGNNTEFIPLTVQLVDANAKTIRIQGKFDVNLKTYGIVVKPFKIGFISIDVADKATVILDMLLTPQTH